MTHDTTAAQLSLTMDALYNNQFLFSDHYLDALLPRDPRWDDAFDEAAAFHAWLRDLYEREGEHLDEYSETQLEAHWFEPIFERLGHVFERQARVPGLGQGIRRPDYAFFASDEDRQAAAAIQKTEAYAQRALAVGEVKQWDVHLSKKQRGGGSSFDRQNPSFQIDYYLKITGLTWGILANGRTWRLVHRETSYRLDTYYEVDLRKLLAQEDAGAIRYFYLFFRQAAFRPDDQGRVFLDDVLAGSEAYALALEEDLQENAYRALELLMQGFLDYAPNGLSADDLREIYDNSLYLLYRLLFILYGESRGLLPVRNPRYNDLYGFGRLMGEITELLDAGTYIGRGSSRYYDMLKSLFHLINGDDPAFNAEINVVRYNGGLFDPQQHPFLARTSVGDRAFTRAVDLLCRRETESGSKEFVDYRTLNVRHLGSIYEGLLEYQPRLAAERMAAIREGKGEQWLPASEAPKGAKVGERRAEGEIYLETDKGERKATGSYYTPQYIVAYIVEQTLGPLVDGILDEIRAAAVPESEAGRAFVARVLALKVLDPSMGSGHFLVEATDYLARALATDPYVEAGAPDGAGEAAESDLNHWRRRVVERCIYGVDKNPLAVELAKLSLWLTTFAGDKPLGFLDHHLKCGDSLVGAQIADLEEQPEVLLSKKEQRQREKEAAAGAQQLGLGLFAGEFNRRLPEMLRELFAIMEAESVDYEAVRAKEAANARVERLKAPFQAVADLYTSAHFGNTYSESEYKAALRAISEPEKLHTLPDVQAAEAIAAERRFLHWELTFPEIFFDRVGAPLPEDAQGFDAVIGNPPYHVSLDKNEADFLDSQVNKSQNGRLDTAALFVEKGLAMPGKLIGYLLPHRLVSRRRDFGRFQEYIYTHTTILEVVYLGPIEEIDANDEFMICVFSPKREDKANEEHIIKIGLDIEEDDFRNKEIQYDEIPQQAWGPPDFIFNIRLATFNFALIRKMESKAFSLGDIAESKDGIVPFIREELVSFERKDERYKRLIGVAGAYTLDRYEMEWGGTWICYDIDEAKKYIDDPKELRKVQLRDQAIFEQPAKIVTRQNSPTLRGTIDRQQFYHTNSVHSTFLKKGASGNYHLAFLLALINSKLLNYYHKTLALKGQDLHPQILVTNIPKLPIRRIDFTTPEAERAALAAQAIALYEDALQQPASSNQLLAFTADQPTDVIHDLLAHLAERMIALNRQKQQRIDDFYLDLEGVTDADTYAKLQKGKQGRTLWRAEACRPYVEEGSYTTHSLEESLGWTEDAYKIFVKKLAGKVSGFSDLVGVYRDHAPAYAARVQRIAATDRIIDRIVYQLYGLTAEEIAIIEAG